MPGCLTRSDLGASSSRANAAIDYLRADDRRPALSTDRATSALRSFSTMARADRYWRSSPEPTPDYPSPSDVVRSFPLFTFGNRFAAPARRLNGYRGDGPMRIPARQHEGTAVPTLPAESGSRIYVVGNKRELPGVVGTIPVPALPAEVDGIEDKLIERFIPNHRRGGRDGPSASRRACVLLVESARRS